MRRILLIIALIGTSALAGDTDWVVVPDSLDPAKAKAAIDEILLKSEIYYQERGRQPDSFEQLLNEGYLDIDSTTLAWWEFNIDFPSPSYIRAFPKMRPGASRLHWVERRDYLFLFKKDSSGHWEKIKTPEYGVETLTIEDQYALTKQVRKALEDIDLELSVYYQECGQYPKTVRELEQKGYMELAPSVYVQWEINFIGDPPASIEAISTYLMPGGKDKKIEYDIVNKKFSGYGVEE